jgi:hypothetical protein
MALGSIGEWWVTRSGRGHLGDGSLRILDQPSFGMCVGGGLARAAFGQMEILESGAGMKIVKGVGHVYFTSFDVDEDFGASPRAHPQTAGAPLELDSGDNQFQTGLKASRSTRRHWRVVNKIAHFEKFGLAALHTSSLAGEGAESKPPSLVTEGYLDLPGQEKGLRMATRVRTPKTMVAMSRSVSRMGEWL